MEFELALRLLKSGYKVKLKSWERKDEFIYMEGRKISHSYHYQWEPTVDELLSNQWECVDGIDYFDQGFADGYAVGWDEALKKYNEVIYGTALPDDVKKYRKDMVKQLRVKVRKKKWKIKKP